MRLQEDVADGRVGPADAIQHRRERRGANLPRRLPQRGERDRQETRVLHVVNPDEPHVAGHRVAELEDRVHQPRGGPVVGAHDRVRTGGVHHEPDARDMCGIQPVHELRRDRRAPRVQRLAIARFPGMDGRRGMLDADEGNPPRSETEQVFGDPVTSATVVDADEIVGPALRVRAGRAIQQDDRNARRVERVRNLQVDSVLARGPFERREEHARDTPVDILAA